MLRLLLVFAFVSGEGDNHIPGSKKWFRPCLLINCGGCFSDGSGYCKCPSNKTPFEDTCIKHSPPENAIPGSKDWLLTCALQKCGGCFQGGDGWCVCPAGLTPTKHSPNCIATQTHEPTQAVTLSPQRLQADHEYTHEDGYKYLLFSSMSYSDTPARCLDSPWSPPQFENYYVHGFKASSKPEDTMAVIAVLPGKEIVLSFRGTNSLKQLIGEAWDLNIENMVPVESGGMVMEYWWNAVAELWPWVKSNVDALVQKYPDYRWVLTGHSLGGSQAAIVASLLSYHGTISKDKLWVYSFGEPRTGDIDYARSHDLLVPNSFRIVNHKDNVPHIPLCKGSGRCKPIPGHPFHHGTEIWYNSDDSTTFKVCDGEPRGEDASCSNGAVGGKVGICSKCHLYYFGFEVGDFGEYNCSNDKNNK